MEFYLFSTFQNMDYTGVFSTLSNIKNTDIYGYVEI